MSPLSPSFSTYEQCIESLDANLSTDEQQDRMMKCIADSLDDTVSGINTFYLIYSASLVFYMQAGFAMLCAGSVRLKNLQNTMLKNLLDACGASLGYYTVGYAFAWGGSLPSASTSTGKSFIGTENFFLMNVEQKSFWLFQYAFAATSATIVAGTLAERCQMVAYLCYSVALTAFVYPVVVHAIWSSSGFLSSYSADPLWGVGVIDFAGCLVVHTTGGITALIAAYVLGPRKGRFYQIDGKKFCNEFPGHSVALKALGVFILWFGWLGFNSGSVYYITNAKQAFIAKNAAVNTTLAAAAGTISSLMAKAWMVEKETGETIFSLTDALYGCLSGLVAITGGCAIVESWASITIGLIAGLIYLAGSRMLIRFCIDDAVDAIPIHMICGIWGSVAVGLFAVPEYLAFLHPDTTHAGWFYSFDDGSLLACQLIGILFVMGWVSALMFPFFALLHYLGWLRADSLEEIVGLDISYHGGVSGPRDGDEDELSRQEYLSAYYERKQQQRANSRGNLRRRVMMRHVSNLNGRNPAMDSEHSPDEVCNEVVISASAAEPNIQRQTPEHLGENSQLSKISDSNNAGNWIAVS